MHRFIAILIGTLLLGAAFAVDFPREGDLVLVSAEGSVVGTGEFEDGNLDLTLLAGFDGFATFTVVDESGNEVSAEVMVDSESSVVFTESFEELREAVAAQGGEVSVRIEEDLEAAGNMAFGAAVPEHVELPEVAREGMDRAEDHADEAEDHAEERGSNGAESSAEAEARVGARGEASAGKGGRDHEHGAEGSADAEADASVGVGVGSSSDD